ncbi:F-box domain-containing protein [Mycena chlorophos]|uniref:F-box domain-containing protein n=1 Tax=Mycena chlorophos TaxID=658473 RepID=A0A8H6S741_MYCCL|nr:F-box domain-containing protein [Mycena chlorophos]
MAARVASPGDANPDPPSTILLLSLPREVLSTIFVFCLPPELFIVPRTETAPLVLTRVNRLIREIALATPQLWASVIWTLDTPERSEKLLEWVSRAGAVDLAIQFSVPEYASKSATLDFEPTLPAEIMARVRYLEADVPPRLATHILKQCHEAVPFLLFLRAPDSATVLQDVLPRFASLCDLRLSNRYVYGAALVRAPRFPTMPLSRLHLSNISCNVLYSILCDCPSMSVLVIGNYLREDEEDQPWHSSSRLITLSHMRLLHICGFLDEIDLGDKQNLLTTPVLPNLEELCLPIGNQTEEEPDVEKADLEMLLSRCPRLERLACTVPGLHVDPVESLRFLEFLLNVNALELRFFRRAQLDAFFKQARNRPELLPQLVHLRIDVQDRCAGYEIELEADGVTPDGWDCVADWAMVAAFLASRFNVDESECQDTDSAESQCSSQAECSDTPSTSRCSSSAGSERDQAMLSMFYLGSDTSKPFGDQPLDTAVEAELERLYEEGLDIAIVGGRDFRWPSFEKIHGMESITSIYQLIYQLGTMRRFDVLSKFD